VAYDVELTFAKELAYEAGEIMKKYYRGDQQVEIKKDESPVTIADKTVNNLVIEYVQSKFPDDGVLGEEASWEPRRKRLWVCDPIDGTVAYIMRIPTSMFSLALVEDGRPIVAVTYNPWTDELYSAVIRQGAYRNEQKIFVSDKKWGPGVCIAASNGSPVNNPMYKDSLKEQNIKVVDFQGGVCKGCLIAEGAIEARIFMHNGAHDIAAVKLIIEEAGGKVTDLEGNEQRYDRPINGAIMSNSLIHDKLLELYANSRH
jgi:myo-inositol-1(or 4)-monophosphatase